MQFLFPESGVKKKSEEAWYLALYELALDVCIWSILEKIWRHHWDHLARSKFPFLAFSNFRQGSIWSDVEKNRYCQWATVTPFQHTNSVLACSVGLLARKLFVIFSCWSVLAALFGENLRKLHSGKHRVIPTPWFRFGSVVKNGIFGRIWQRVVERPKFENSNRNFVWVELSKADGYHTTVSEPS